MKIVLATRGSPLALWQTEEVRRLLCIAHPSADVELSILKSTGDRDDRLDVSSLGRTGVFTAEIDGSVLAGASDAGVHSLKDMMTSLPEGLVLAGTLARASADDALVSREGRRLKDLPRGARVATGSLRRAAMLRRARPDFEIVPIRRSEERRVGKECRSRWSPYH